MNTWSFAHLILDFLFATSIAGVIAGFLLFRERRLKLEFEGSIARLIDSKPISERAQVPTGEEDCSAPSVNRAQKYLEAVRMYRQGRKRQEIEKRLGVSMVELELLGKIK